MARERFYFYEEWWNVLSQLKEGSAMAAIKAACTYVFEEKDTTKDLDETARVAFMFIKEKVDRDQEAYNLVVERNRANGQNGGRPRKTQANPENPVGYLETEKTQANPENPEKPDKSRVDRIRVDKKEENINNSLSLSDEQREREIFEISLLFLRKGIESPVSEARDYYKYYQASGWRKSNEHETPIRDRVAYAQTWKTKRENIISEDEGEFWANTIKAIQFQNMKLAQDLINGYRGYIKPDQDHIRLFFLRRATGQTLIKLMNDNEEFKTRVFQSIVKQTGPTQNVSVDIAANDPRR